MYDGITDRVIEEAVYIIETGATVRKTGKAFHLGKSTVHKDVTERLREIEKRLYKKVKKVLGKNLAERHLRGGEATKRKYIMLKEKGE